MYSLSQFFTLSNTKRLLLPFFLLAVLTFSFSVSFAADDWQLQEENSSGSWRPRGTTQFADKLLCARGAKDAVTNGAVNTGNIRCVNLITSEIVNWPGLDRAINEADAPPPAPSLQCKVETPSLWPIGYWGTFPSLLPCGPNGVNCLECGICGLLMLGQRIIYVMLSALIFIVAPVRFIWAGFLILVSRGSSERVSQGQKMIYHTVVGLLIGLGAFVIIQTFLWVLGGANFTDEGLGWPTINCQRNLKP